MKGYYDIRDGMCNKVAHIKKVYKSYTHLLCTCTELVFTNHLGTVL